MGHIRLGGPARCLTLIHVPEVAILLSSGSEPNILVPFGLRSFTALGLNMRHPARVLSIAADGPTSVIATTCLDGCVRTWELCDGSAYKCTRQLRLGNKIALSVALRVDLHLLVATSHDRESEQSNVHAWVLEPKGRTRSAIAGYPFDVVGRPEEKYEPQPIIGSLYERESARTHRLPEVAIGAGGCVVVASFSDIMESNISSWLSRHRFRGNHSPRLPLSPILFYLQAFASLRAICSASGRCFEADTCSSSVPRRSSRGIRVGSSGRPSNASATRPSSARARASACNR